MSEVLKTCTACLRNLPVANFYREKHGSYGVRSRCKECFERLRQESKRTYRCGHCGKEYRRPPSRVGQFCSISCSADAKAKIVACANCGKLVRYSLSRIRKYCSQACMGRHRSGANHPTWALRRTERTGYVTVFVPNHPNRNSHGRIFEHRLVMEQSLGRLLKSNETVHHINGNRADNRIENLQLRTGMHGPGIVHRCVDCGSTNVVSEKIA